MNSNRTGCWINDCRWNILLLQFLLNYLSKIPLRRCQTRVAGFIRSIQWHSILRTLQSIKAFIKQPNPIMVEPLIWSFHILFPAKMTSCQFVSIKSLLQITKSWSFHKFWPSVCIGVPGHKKRSQLLFQIIIGGGCPLSVSFSNIFRPNYHLREVMS